MERFHNFLINLGVHANFRQNFSLLFKAHPKRGSGIFCIMNKAITCHPQWLNILSKIVGQHCIVFLIANLSGQNYKRKNLQITIVLISCVLEHLFSNGYKSVRKTECDDCHSKGASTQSTTCRLTCQSTLSLHKCRSSDGVYI